MTGPKIKPKISSDTYPDGIGADRCTHCGAVLRHGGEPMVMIRRSDAEAMLRVFANFIVISETHFGLVQRLEQAVGRTVRQMEADKP